MAVPKFCIKPLLALVLMMVVGFSADLLAAKRLLAAEPENNATLLSVRVPGGADSSVIEIAADKPLTYTSYKLTSPPRVVIDLAHTTAAAFVSPLDITAANVVRVDVEKFELTGGKLTRIQITLVKDVDFAVKADATEPGKLIVSLASPSAEPAPSSAALPETTKDVVITPAQTVAAAIQPAAPKPVDVVAESALAQPAPPATPIAAEQPKAALQDAVGKPTPIVVAAPVAMKPELAPAVRGIRSINVTKDAVEIIADGGVEQYKSFKLTNPDRLVLDIPEHGNAMTVRQVSINAFGIGTARIGEYPDKVRIVFDGAKGGAFDFTVQKSEGGLKIIPVDHPVVAKESASPPIARKPAPPESSGLRLVAGDKKSGRSQAPAIESIDFTMKDGVSQVAVRTSGQCKPGQPMKTKDGVVLTFKNCALPKSLQRTLETRAFASVVQQVTPYQVKTKTGFTTRILVRLRQDAPYEFVDGDSLAVLKFKDEGQFAPATAPDRELAEEPVSAQSVVARSAATTPKSHAEPVMESVPAVAPTSKILDKKVYSGRRVTLEFADADVRKIFQLLAEVSNLNFLVGDDVTGTISIKLVNVPWDQALEVILESKGLGMKRDGNIVQIRPKEKIRSIDDEESAAKKSREKNMILRTEIFDINYATASDVVNQFTTMKSDRGTITFDVRTNRVIVKDIDTYLDDMRALLKSIDLPERQVMIEARIVEAQTNFTNEIGVAWGLKYADGSASTAAINAVTSTFGGIINPALPNQTAGGMTSGISFGKLTSNIQLDMKISALASIGKVKIISSPKILTLNNKSAKIEQGLQQPYSSISSDKADTKFVEASLALEVTPHVTADGSISMKIRAKNDSVGPTGNPPPIVKKEATTELVLKNGETTVIGGIYVDNETTADTGVPYLKDIPYLGWLFKSKSVQKIKNELLIFITPRIVS